MSWRGIVLAVVKVPHQPEPPPGSPPKVFRAAPNFLTLRTIQWMFSQAFLLILPVLLTIGRAHDPPPVLAVILDVMIATALALYFTQFIFGWAVLRLDYELRWYMLSDRAIRIREGIAFVREKTIALANVQNIEVRQGPLQRLLGIADVEVMTAGGSVAGSHKKGMGEPMHVAYFRGVDNAEEIRDLVREGVRRQKDAGLGDPDDHHHQVVASHAASEAMVELLREARKLRAVVEAAALRFPRSEEA